MRRIIFYIATVLLAVQVQAQSNKPLIKAYFDKDSILIGDQFSLWVEVDKDIMQIIDFPAPQDGKIAEKIELIKEFPTDTVAKDGRQVKLKKRYLVTTFDEGEYKLAPIPVLYLDKNVRDTLWTPDTLRIRVGTFEIDTATQKIYDITKPLETPLKAGEISGYIGWTLLGVALLALLVWLYIRYRKNLPLLGKAKVKLPPHIIAITALEALHNQKLWQNNRHKLYYTAITDIVREYITDRYGVGAMEMTSEEILASLKECGITAKSLDDIKQVLKLSDLVKFAKFTPESDDNEEAYRKSYYFVEDTKPVEIEPTEQKGETKDE